ncbi:HSP20-like chaperone [Pilaira anomala]|nr:HSP20-like chaperone [Pilaira anomala]
MDLAPSSSFFKCLREMQRAVAMFFEHTFFKGGPSESLLKTPDSIKNNFVRYPASVMVETPDSFELSVELPGYYDKRNIKKVDMVDNHRTLVLSGSIIQEYEESDTPASTTEKEDNYGGTKADQQHEPSDYHWWVNERVSGSFTKLFSFPQPVHTDSIKASYSNGALKVTVPKTTTDKNSCSVC